MNKNKFNRNFENHLGYTLGNIFKVIFLFSFIVVVGGIVQGLSSFVFVKTHVHDSLTMMLR